MAKRNRVPGRKSLHGGKRTRNKNPKLSPFQREQKRDRLANQPPVDAQGKRDFPASQRGVYQYLMEREAREAEKKLRLKRAREDEEGKASPNQPEEATTEEKEEEFSLAPPEVFDGSQEDDVDISDDDSDVDSSCRPSSSAVSRKQSKNKYRRIEEEAPVVEDAAAQQPIKKKKKSGGSGIGDDSMASLNDELRSNVSPIEDRMNSASVKRKEKKHQKKVEARKVRIVERMESLEAELEDALKRSTSKKKNKRTGDSDVDSRNAAYERELKRMQRDKAVEDERIKKENLIAAEKKKKISFQIPGDSDAADGHRVAQPARVKAAQQTTKDFYDYVDVVKFGERVEGPPVFDMVPNKNAAVSKLAARLQQEEEAHGGASSSSRHAYLAGANTGMVEKGSLAERKRLASLGLAPRVTESIGLSSSTNSTNKPSVSAREQEFEMLRRKVMESYQRSKVQRHMQTRTTKSDAVNLNHSFPQI